MFYSETPSYRLTPSKLQPHSPGDKLYFYVQAFHVTGAGSTETEKAQDLNVNHLGSAWSDVVEMTMTK